MVVDDLPSFMMFVFKTAVILCYIVFAWKNGARSLASEVYLYSNVTGLIPLGPSEEPWRKHFRMIYPVGRSTPFHSESTSE